MLKESSCTDIQRAIIAILIKIIIKKKKINATFESIEERPQKTVIQPQELKMCLPTLAAED
jgi:hypothetical protein